VQDTLAGWAAQQPCDTWQQQLARSATEAAVIATSCGLSAWDVSSTDWAGYYAAGAYPLAAVFRTWAIMSALPPARLTDWVHLIDQIN